MRRNHREHPLRDIREELGKPADEPRAAAVLKTPDIQHERAARLAMRQQIRDGR